MNGFVSSTILLRIITNQELLSNTENLLWASSNEDPSESKDSDLEDLADINDNISIKSGDSDETKDLKENIQKGKTELDGMQKEREGINNEHSRAQDNDDEEKEEKELKKLESMDDNINEKKKELLNLKEEYESRSNKRKRDSDDEGDNDREGPGPGPGPGPSTGNTGGSPLDYVLEQESLEMPSIYDDTE